VESLAVFVRLLARSATGDTITQYTSTFRGPRKGAAMHVILVDNGRSARLGMKRFWHSLKCIRCAACMNTCPVYRRSGGLSYGSTYMGPIGIIMMPTFEIRKYSELPFSSTLNGSCTNVCPVKIDIHEQIYGWREVMEENDQIQVVKKKPCGWPTRCSAIRRSTRSQRPHCRPRWKSSPTSPFTTAWMPGASIGRSRRPLGKHFTHGIEIIAPIRTRKLNEVS
jgi:L-lactate utilization protein LutB